MTLTADDLARAGIKLTDAAERLLAPFDTSYRMLALAAVSNCRAFCPSCRWAGMSNCGYFDECGAFVSPDGSAADERNAILSALEPTP